MELGLKDWVALVCGASKGFGEGGGPGPGAGGGPAGDLFPKPGKYSSRRPRRSAGTPGRRSSPCRSICRPPKKARRLFRSAHQHYGQVDILVNNAGGASLPAFSGISAGINGRRPSN